MEPIRIGIGGWNFAPWRGTFYPPGLPQTQELAFASQNLTSIEINSTFYGAQKPESFRKWREQTPDGFMFAVKGPRYATNRRDLTGAGESIQRFLTGGVLELGDKLGPILWQFPATRKFDPAAMRPFLEALPPKQSDHHLRHVIETQHPSFADPAWINLLHEFGAAPAIVDSDKHTMVADLTAGFVYARLERNAEAAPEGYDTTALDAWASRIRAWAAGKSVIDLAREGPAEKKPPPRPCFVYFISGDKVRAPDAARAMLRRLGPS